MDYYNVKCILGLTATATQQTINEIKSYFNIDVNNIMLSCKLPDSLLVSVSEDTNKERALVNLLKSNEFKPFFNHVIIYCSRREQTEKLSQLLRLSFVAKQSYANNLERLEKMGPYKQKKTAKSQDNENVDIAEAYHAGLTSHARKRIQNNFIQGKLRVIVATMAFGMGIDMKNIRAVIHYNMPKSIENYVQEIGRAGRDGQLSRCHLFLDTQREDINDVKKYIHMDGYDNLIIKKLVMRLFEVCEKDNCHSTEEFGHHVALPVQELVEALDIKEETIMTLLCYLQSANYIRLMSNCAKTATLKSYKGFSHLNEMARHDSFVAAVLNNKTNANEYSEGAEVNIDVIELCNKLNGDYGIIRNRLKQLEWIIDSGGKYKAKSGVSIQFTNISFHVKRKCVASDSVLDDIYELLWNRVCTQTNFCHRNFNALYKILNENSYKSIGDYIDSFDAEAPNEDELDEETEPIAVKLSTHFTEKNNSLKQKLNEYFVNELDINEYSKTSKVNFEDNPFDYPQADIDRLITNVNRFIYTYMNEMKLNGHIIARIFHGIGTPRLAD